MSIKPQSLLFLGVVALVAGAILWDAQSGGSLSRWLEQAGADSTAQEKILRVGTNRWPGYEPLFLARDLGYFRDTRLELLEYLSATQVSRALRNGVIQVATMTLDEVLILREYALPIQIILVLDVSHGGDVIISRPMFPDLASLKHHRIGVENTALGAYVLSRALQINGLQRKDFIVVPAEINEHEARFKQGEVDAVVTFEPVRSHLLKMAGRQIFDSSQMPGEIVDVLVIREEIAQSHAKELRALLQSWFRALDYFQAEPEDASVRMAPRLEVPPQQVVELFDGLKLPGRRENLSLIGNPNPSLRETAARLNSVMREAELLRGPSDLEHFLAPQFLQRLSGGS